MYVADLNLSEQWQGYSRVIAVAVGNEYHHFVD